MPQHVDSFARFKKSVPRKKGSCSAASVKFGCLAGLLPKSGTANKSLTAGNRTLLADKTTNPKISIERPLRKSFSHYGSLETWDQDSRRSKTKANMRTSFCVF